MHWHVPSCAHLCSELSQQWRTSAVTRIRYSPVSDYLRQEDSERPDVRLDGKPVVVGGLWGGPLDRKPRAHPRLVLVFLQGKVRCSQWQQASAGHFHIFHKKQTETTQIFSCVNQFLVRETKFVCRRLTQQQLLVVSVPVISTRMLRIKSVWSIQTFVVHKHLQVHQSYGLRGWVGVGGSEPHWLKMISDHHWPFWN